MVNMKTAFVENSFNPPTRVTVVIGLLFNEAGHVLIALRPPQVVSPGFWEFPGGKVEKDESLEVALAREFREEIGVEVTQAVPFTRIESSHQEKIFILNVFRIEAYSGEASGCEQQDIRFVPVSTLADYTFLPANKGIIEQLMG
jgi:8-oxo-dGTP diphosphatase